MKLNKIFPTLGLVGVLATIAPLASSCTVYIEKEDDPEPEPEPTGDFEWDYKEQGVCPQDERYSDVQTSLDPNVATSVYFEAITKDDSLYANDMMNYITFNWSHIADPLDAANISIVDLKTDSGSIDNNPIINVSMDCNYNLQPKGGKPLILKDLQIRNIPVEVSYQSDKTKNDDGFWQIQPYGYDVEKKLIDAFLSKKDWSINGEMNDGSTTTIIDLNSETFYQGGQISLQFRVIVQLLFNQHLSYFENCTPPQPIDWEYEYDFAQQKGQPFKSDFDGKRGESLSNVTATSAYFQDAVSDKNIFDQDMLAYITSSWVGKKIKSAHINIASTAVEFNQDSGYISMVVNYLYSDGDTNVEYDLTISQLPMTIYWDSNAWTIRLPEYENTTNQAACIKFLTNPIESNKWSIVGNKYIDDSKKPMPISFNRDKCKDSSSEILLDRELNDIIVDLLWYKSSAYLSNTKYSEK